LAFRDLREVLGHLERTGQLVHIAEPISAVYDVAAALALAGRDLQCALQLDQVSGYAFPVVGNLACSRAVIAAGMGVPEEELLERFAERLRVPLPTRQADEAPVLEQTGAGLADLPILTHCAEDAAPYITAGLISLRDPETGDILRTVCRMEVRGENQLGAALVTPPAGNRMARFRDLGRPIPAAVSIGMDPVTFLGCALGGPHGADRLAAAGGLRAEGVEVIESPLSGIAVPARTEFLLEGELDPGDCRSDGPFGEISGYGVVFPETPTVHVRRISHRTTPLYHALVPTGAEADRIICLAAEASLVPDLCRNFPDIVDVRAVSGSFGSSVVVRIRPTDRPRVRAILHQVISLDRVKKAVAIAADVAPDDPREVEWSIATRCQPDRDVIVLTELRGHPIDPSCPAPAPCSKVGIDATGFERVRGVVRSTFPPGALENAGELLRKKVRHG
jgi:2,5-furandicarboxylate decarboxylase 1